MIDLFSRKLFSRGIKKKTKDETEQAMRDIVKENNNRSPFKLWTDRGMEWLSLTDFYDEMEIVRYSTNSSLKSVFIERANLSLQDLLYRSMTSLNTAKWVDLLQDCVSTYNLRVSKVLYGLCPQDAHKPENEEYLRSCFLTAYQKFKEKFKNKKPKFSVGQTVRVRKEKQLFQRGYEPTTDMAQRTIEKILLTTPVTYKLSGLKRAVYEPELFPTEPPSNEREKHYYIAGTRKVNQKRFPKALK